MRKFVIVLLVLSLLLVPNLSHAQKFISDYFYGIKHSKTDSILLQFKPNHKDLIIGTRFSKGNDDSDTLIISLNNESKYNILRRLKGVVYSISQNYNSGAFIIDSIKPLENITLKFKISKSSDSLYLFLSDFSNGIRKHYCGNVNNEEPKKQEDLGLNAISFQRIEIDDSSLVAQIPVKAYKVDGKFQSGEKVLLKFIYKLNDLAYPISNMRLKVTAESHNISFIPIKHQVSNPKAGQQLSFIYQCVASENLKTIPVELELSVNGKQYKKEVETIINSNVIKTENTIIAQEERNIELNFKENILQLSFRLPPISWNQSYEFRLDYNFDNSQYKAYYFKSNSSQGIIREVGVSEEKFVKYNLSYKKITNNDIFKGLVFCLTPSYSNLSHISNYKYGFRLIRATDIGYYIEANTTLNFQEGDYNYNILTKEMQNFDSYKSYYEFKNGLRVLSRDIGAGLVYRPSKNLLLQLGMSYYTFKVKQKIDVIDYGNEIEYISKYATLLDYDLKKLVVKSSICYIWNSTILGISFSNYDSNQFRPSINIGKKL